MRRINDQPKYKRKRMLFNKSTLDKKMDKRSRIIYKASWIY